MSYSTITKKTCKCGCGKPFTIGFKGYNSKCVPEEERQQFTKKRVSQRNKANTAAIARKLYKVQQKKYLPNLGLKRANKPISKVSKKRLENLKIYNVLRKDYLKDHPKCEAKLGACQGKSKDIHHKAKRELNLNNVDTWMAVCRNCHTEIHFDSKMAYEKGLLIR